MKTTLPVVVALALTGVATAWSSVPAPVSAQIHQERESCRCVDADGNELDDCSCFRAPSVEGLLGTLAFDGGRPRLGISVDGGQRASLDASGALVTDVMEGGPADEAGIREGDLIVSLDGHPLSEPIGGDAERGFDLDESIPVQRLLALARELEPGERVEIVFLRNGERRTAEVEPEDLSETWGRRLTMSSERWDRDMLREQLRSLGDGVRSWGNDMRVIAPGGVLFGTMGGLSVVEVNPELGEYFGADEGVLVTEVDRRSGLGLEPGDVVLRIGDRPVSDPDRFRRVLGSYGDEEDITFHLMRHGSETTVVGRLRY